MKKSNKPKLHIVAGEDDRLSRFDIVEPLICDLYRAAHITFLMHLRDQEQGSDDPLGSLGMFMAEQTERLAKELRDAYYGRDGTDD